MPKVLHMNIVYFCAKCTNWYICKNICSNKNASNISEPCNIFYHLCCSGIKNSSSLFDRQVHSHTPWFLFCKSSRFIISKRFPQYRSFASISVSDSLSKCFHRGQFLETQRTNQLLTFQSHNKIFRSCNKTITRPPQDFHRILHVTGNAGKRDFVTGHFVVPVW